ERRRGQGYSWLLEDAIAWLKEKQLVAVRTTEAGEEEVQATPKVDPRFQLDPELEHLLPRSPDEVARLEQSLLAHGCEEPLVVWEEKKILIDGYTRYRLLSLLGRPYAVKVRSFAGREAVKDWIYETHYGRRSLTPELKSYVRGRHYLALKQQQG